MNAIVGKAIQNTIRPALYIKPGTQVPIQRTVVIQSNLHAQMNQLPANRSGPIQVEVNNLQSLPETDEYQAFSRLA